MSRTKTIVLAMAGAMAIAAIGASSAQGTEWEFEVGGENIAYVTGSQITHNNKSFHIFKVGKFEVFCKKVSLIWQTGPKSSKLTLTPTYGECQTESGLAATITVNGCDYVMYGGTQSEKDKNDFFDGAFEVACAGAVKKMEIHIYESAFAHFVNSSFCTATIPVQKTVAATYLNTPTAMIPDVDITTEVELEIEMKGNPFTCGTWEGAEYIGATTLRAYSDAAHSKQIATKVGP
jgi:hypothetical protein